MSKSILVGLVAFGLVACGNNGPANSDQPIDDADRVEAPVDGGPVVEETVPAATAPVAAPELTADPAPAAE